MVKIETSNLEGLIWTPARTRIKQVCLFPDTSDLSYQGWKDYWHERHARMMSLPELYSAIKTGLITFEPPTDSFDSWIYAASETEILNPIELQSEDDGYQVLTHLDNQIDRPIRVNLHTGTCWSMHEFLRDFPGDARKYLRTEDSDDTIISSFTRFLNVAQVQISTISAKMEQNHLVMFGRTRDAGLEFGTIVLTCAMHQWGLGTKTYGVPI